MEFNFLDSFKDALIKALVFVGCGILAYGLRCCAIKIRERKQQKTQERSLDTNEEYHETTQLQEVSANQQVSSSMALKNGVKKANDEENAKRVANGQAPVAFDQPDCPSSENTETVGSPFLSTQSQSIDAVSSPS